MDVLLIAYARMIMNMVVIAPIMGTRNTDNTDLLEYALGNPLAPKWVGNTEGIRG